MSSFLYFISYYRPHILLFTLDMGTAIIASLLSVMFPYLTRLLLQIYIPQKNVKVIIYLILLIAVIYLVKAVMNFIRIKWGHILGVRIEYDMRQNIFAHLQKLSFNYFDNVKTGHIMSRISNDLNMISEVAHHAPEDLIISLVVILSAFVFMFMFNYKLALIAIIPLPVMLGWGWLLGTKMRSGFLEVRKKIADLNSTVENSVQGIREVKAYTNEELELSKFKDVNVNFRFAKERIYTIMAVFYSGMHLFRDFYYLLIIIGGIWLILVNQITTADLIAFILYLGIILPPIDRLINFIEQYQQGGAAFQRFVEVMKIQPDIKDRKNAYDLIDPKGHIAVKNIIFKYSTSSDLIINNVSFEAESGKTIAIVGESGAGKSTIVSLIPRFYEAQSGNIFIDGHDIMDLSQKSLRENIGIVQQNVFLFDGTIRDNISYGRPETSEADIIKAVKLANLYEFLKSLPDGLDTQVGEHGIKLSGGQKQRISIARVFIKNPRIIIFDEATSSLDNESEHLIQESMKALSKNRTMIIIAHRLSTVRDADKLYVMKNGSIVEEGSHLELMAQKNYYYNLYSKNQLGGAVHDAN